jgi:hypothetical protein
MLVMEYGCKISEMIGILASMPLNFDGGATAKHRMIPVAPRDAYKLIQCQAGHR